jgi:hypothetical protein
MTFRIVEYGLILVNLGQDHRSGVVKNDRDCDPLGQVVIASGLLNNGQNVMKMT